MRPSWTLRDIRRAMSRGPHAEAAGIAVAAGIRSLADIDRLISRYGPDSPVALDRQQAGRTDHEVGDDEAIEIEDGFDEAAAVHGGDGNSGECDSLAETAADNQPVSDTACAAGGAGDTPDDPSGAGGADGLGNEAPASRDSDAASGNAAEQLPAEQPTGQGDDGGDEPTGEMGTQPSASADAGDNGPSAQGVSSAKAGIEQAQDGICDAGAANGRDADSPAASSAGIGSADCLDQEAAEAALRDARQAHAARRLVAALRKVVEAACAPRGAASPRYDGKRLVRELVSRRYALHRARRDEREIRDVVIAVDVSPSCRAVCAATYAAALQAAALLPRDRVTVVTHSNGRQLSPVEGYAPDWIRRVLASHADGLAAHYFSARQVDASASVWQTIAARRPGLVIFLGDMDSWQEHNLLHDAGVPVMLMTHVPAEVFSGENMPQYKLVPDVNDTITAADGLEAAIAKKGGIL